MHAVSIVRRCLDPRFLGSLRLKGEALEIDRIPTTENEGDVRGMALLKDAGMPWRAISTSPLDPTQRAYLMVRGAQEVLEPAQGLPDAEELLAQALVEGIKAAPDQVGLVVVGECEQDSGRRLLPALLAAVLGWTVVRGATSLRVEGQSALVEIEGEGSRTICLPLPVVVVPHESNAMGADPSDAYDLVEKFEKSAAARLSTNPAPAPTWTDSGMDVPRARVAGTLRPLDSSVVEDAIQRILATKA